MTVNVGDNVTYHGVPLLTLQDLDWRKIGEYARECATDAHDGELVDPSIAYSFVCQDNTMDFFDPSLGEDADWPEGMPYCPPDEFLESYYDCIGTVQYRLKRENGGWETLVNFGVSGRVWPGLRESLAIMAGPDYELRYVVA